MKLNVYTRQNGRVVFKDFDILSNEYENKMCKKIIYYKFNKIFLVDSEVWELAKFNPH